tara:strand:- start:464 stop:745 length:282 start_codon:yes stop_codon:yes gene_type:complete
MSVARITTVTFSSSEAANVASSSYADNAPSDFPEAEQLIGVIADENKLVAVTLYPDHDAMERATTSRKKVLDANKEVLSVDTMVGSVEINHSN